MEIPLVNIVFLYMYFFILGCCFAAKYKKVFRLGHIWLLLKKESTAGLFDKVLNTGSGYSSALQKPGFVCKTISS
jgi:hypothetical protein